MPIVFTSLAGDLEGTALQPPVDGLGAAANFYSTTIDSPFACCTDSSGNIYVMDGYALRKITPAGLVSSIAGLYNTSAYTDGTGAAARFEAVNGLTVDASGNIYAIELASFTVRKITPAGVVTTITGQVGVQGVANGTGLAATFNNLRAIQFGSDGNLYILDTNAIRKVTLPGLVVTTFAGNILVGGVTDGTGTAARFNGPTGLTESPIDSALYVLDTNVGNTAKVLRKVTVPGAVVTTPALTGTVIPTSSSGIDCDDNGSFYVNNALLGPPHLLYTITAAFVTSSDTMTFPNLGAVMNTIVITGSLYVFALFTGYALLVFLTDPNYSGLYRLNPGSLHDTYVNDVTGLTENVKIPDPSFKTGFING